jgi:hypothetical protein
MDPQGVVATFENLSPKRFKRFSAEQIRGRKPSLMDRPDHVSDPNKDEPPEKLVHNKPRGVLKNTSTLRI